MLVIYFIIHQFDLINSSTFFRLQMKFVHFRTFKSTFNDFLRYYLIIKMTKIRWISYLSLSVLWHPNINKTDLIVWRPKKLCAWSVKYDSTFHISHKCVYGSFTTPNRRIQIAKTMYEVSPKRNKLLVLSLIHIY